MKPETLEKRRKYSLNYYHNMTEEQKKAANQRRKEIQDKKRAAGIQSFERCENYQALTDKKKLIKDSIALKGVFYG